MLSDIRILTAEEIGLKSEYVENFLDNLEKNRVHMHSFLIMRDGKIGAEGYWYPYTKDTTHRMYSVTKSFVAVAIGLLADEGKISLDDKVVSFFPDLVPENVHPYIADATIKNLLTMSTMYSKSTYDIDMSEWLKSYFTSKPDHPPGTMYFYDSCGSYTLGAVVKRVTGKFFDEYLDEKIFRKLGFAPGRYCLTGPDGERWAGSGLLITTRELAAFANLLLNDGVHNGERLISHKFVSEATSKQVMNRNDGADYAYWCGYGYQIWILRDNAFCFNGLGGQLAIAFPDKGVVFACTADVQGNPVGKNMIFDALWSEIIAKLDAPMQANSDASETLRKRCENLKMQPFEGEAHSQTEKRIGGRKYILNENPMGISDLKLTFEENCGTIEYTTPRGKKELCFGLMEFIESRFPETHYPGDRLKTPANRMYRCINSGSWADENTFVINTGIVDDFVGNMTTVIAFKNDEIGISMHKYAQFFLDEYHGYAGGKMEGENE